jgi:hypothetical protein
MQDIGSFWARGLGDEEIFALDAQVMVYYEAANRPPNFSFPEYT